MKVECTIAVTKNKFVIIVTTVVIVARYTTFYLSKV